MTIEMKQAIKNEIETLKSNEIIREFVETEAYKKIADDISKLPGRCCTERAARLIVHNIRNKAIKTRWNQYVTLGYMAVINVKYNQ